jgi:hypothetical protein
MIYRGETVERERDDDFLWGLPILGRVMPLFDRVFLSLSVTWYCTCPNGVGSSPKHLDILFNKSQS